jgi:hypothetical protein
MHWTAVKVTSHEAPASGGAFEIVEQNSEDDSDTGRYLAAGAARALLVRSSREALRLAMQALRETVTGNVIVESNSAVRWLNPDIYLMAVNTGEADLKTSARENLDRVDAFVVTGTTPDFVQGRKWFQAEPPVYAGGELLAFVIALSASAGRANDK